MTNLEKMVLDKPKKAAQLLAAGWAEKESCNAKCPGRAVCAQPGTSCEKAMQRWLVQDAAK